MKSEVSLLLQSPCNSRTGFSPADQSNSATAPACSPATHRESKHQSLVSGQVGHMGVRSVTPCTPANVSRSLPETGSLCSISLVTHPRPQSLLLSRPLLSQSRSRTWTSWQRRMPLQPLPGQGWPDLPQLHALKARCRSSRHRSLPFPEPGAGPLLEAAQNFTCLSSEKAGHGVGPVW